MASGKVKGITIEFTGETNKLDKAIKEVNKETKKLDKELRQVDKALKLDPKNVELLSQKQQILSKNIYETEGKLKALKEQQKQMDAKGVDKNSEEYRKLQREIMTTENKLDHLRAGMEKLNSVKLTALAKQLEITGEKLKTTGKTLSKYVTVPLTAVGAASVKTGLDFDEAMSQVAATLGVTVDEVDELRKYALLMGSTTSFSATEAAEALNYMALAGYDAETSMKMLPVVLNLAAAGGMDLATASDMVTDAQSALGLSIEDTEKMVDEMAKTASKTNTSVEQLGSAYLTVGGTARNLKGGTAELAQVLGLLGDNGIKGSEGGTSLRNMLLSLGSPTDKARAQLDKLGISLYDDAGNMRSLEDVFLDLSDALADANDEERAFILSQIFNKRDLKAVNALLNTDKKRWDEVADAIGDANGAAEEMAQTQLDNLKGSLTILKSALEGAAIAISDVLSPWIRKLADFITNLTTKFNELSPTAKKVIVYLGTALAALGPALILVGNAMNLVSKAILNGTKVVNGFSKALTFVAANPIVLVIALIAALAAGFVYLWKKSEKFRDFFIGMWDRIKTKVDNFVTAFKSAKQKIVEEWKALPEVFSSIWTRIGTGLKNLGTRIGDAVLGAIKSGINGVITTIENVINKAIGLINMAIRLANKLPGVNVGEVGRVSLPRLARGGIVDSATLALIGEGRSSEAVIPLDELWKRMDKMTQSLAGIGGEGITINVYGASGQSVTDLAREVERAIINAQKRRTMVWA